jgi:hypothetical protein
LIKNKPQDVDKVGKLFDTEIFISDPYYRHFS